MSEMLGNQYFMARNYAEAVTQFENVLIQYPENKSIKKKLIVCYSQTGKLDAAVNFLYKMIIEDIEFIINTDPIKDDCPCPELVEYFEKDNSANYDSAEFNLILGIIWLFCDINKSLEYFNKTNIIDAENIIVSKIISVLENYINSNKTA